MSSDRSNVVVVGGGIIGCSVAYYLARAGASVTLLERGSMCAESSSAAAGLASVGTREGLLLDLARESLRMMAEASQEIGIDFELVPRGSLALLRTEEELAEQRAVVDAQCSKGVEIELLDRETTLELEPATSPEVLGAVYSPADCNVNPYAATLAFAAGARRWGATLRTGVEVTALVAEGGRIRAVATRDGVVAGDFVVVAAGAWSPFLTRTVGLDLPIEPSRGQIMVTEPLPPLVRRTIKDTGHTYICPTAHANYVIGSITEKVGFNKQLTPDKLHHYAAESSGLLPALRRVRIVRTWAGLRPLTPDSQPFLGAVQGYEGLVLACGHSRLGILFSAVTSKMVADLITSDRADFPFEPFGVGRFGAVA